MPLARLTKILVWAFIIVAAIIWFVQGEPAKPSDVLKVMSLGVTVTGLVLLVVFAPTGRWSSWRFIWQVFPGLNDAVFPDLNGTWEGTQESNWSKIDVMRKAACQKGALAADFLDSVNLLELPITIEIKASLFELQWHFADDRFHLGLGCERAHSISGRPLHTVLCLHAGDGVDLINGRISTRWCRTACLLS